MKNKTELIGYYGSDEIQIIKNVHHLLVFSR
jgi:hypothetical protein